ncbi:hypothetical protein MHJ63_00265 [Pseudoglutamicibacter albus]|uniref:hypothetical protein n=1 Tax=Pseudoglutamicibacter albus TaxID=98671 RepID=UPI001EF714D9|nr:hypothetical protein [Pseudoglutamicibacter albus]MCG7303725.1 hypothetical protein [Pseudoglutamicibacter albus]
MERKYETTTKKPGASDYTPAVAPKSFANRPVWLQACTASALDRSGAVTGSTKVAGSDLHVAEMVDLKARNAAKTQACTRRAVDECGQRDDLLYTSNTATTQLACRAKSKPSKNGAPAEQAPLTITEIRTLIATETKRIRIHPGAVTTDAIKPNTLTTAWTNFYLTNPKHNTDDKNGGNDKNSTTSNSDTATVDGVVRETIEVLDENVTVELTPIKYRWKYGDGEARTSKTAGKMLPTRADVWEKETPTSHMYQKRGTFRVEATVTYTGKYSLDNGETWDTIPGTLETQATPLDIRVWSMRSVNVSGPCQPGNPNDDPTCKIQDFTIFKPRQTR